ncbi:hypothetical protein [Bradyrhizobium sp. USDA 4353]
MKKAVSAALFCSFKTSRAIPCARPHRRDFMIQSTLDPGVRHIEYHPIAVIDDHAVASETLVLARDDGRYAIDFVDARPPEDLHGQGLLQIGFEQGCSGIMEVTRSDIGREPRLSAARQVWRFNAVTITAGDRAQVLDALDQEGPLPLRALRGLTATRRDVTEVIYALATEGSLSIDLSAGLDGRTIVRAGVSYAPAGLCLRYGT